MSVDPVTVQVRLDDLRELITAAQMCADDLQTELEERWPERKGKPTHMRRFCNDMKVVERSKRAIQAVDVTLFEPVFRYE